MFSLFSRRSAALFAAVTLGVIAVVAAVVITRPRAASSQTRPDGGASRDKRSARLRELDEKLKNPGMLLLRAAEFDPRAGEPQPLRLGARRLEMTRLSAAPPTSQLEADKQAGASDRAYFIVQFADTIQPEETAALGTRGYEIAAYVPNNAYIVRAPRTRQSELQLSEAAGEFRWVGSYGAGLKVEPELADLANRASTAGATEAAEVVRVGFSTFRGESAAGVRAALARLGLTAAANVVERFDARASGIVTVRAGQLAAVIEALASVEGVEWVEREELPRMENDNGVRIIQSGGTGANSTPLYVKGLTGAGQIIGVADSGLDTDHAQFRLSADAASQTLSFATSTQDLVSGALKVNVTNPNNKVLAYYVLGTGALIDKAANPNGGKILDPDATNNAVAYDDTSGSFHGTHVTSVAAGRDFAADGSGSVGGIATRTSGDGVAPDARIVFQDVGRPGGSLTGLNVGTALMHMQAYNTGARVHNNSYGGAANSTYNTQARDTDDMMWRLRDYTVFFSAGNSGPAASTMTKDSKSALLVGGAESPTGGGSFVIVAQGSSHGPMRDGRIKPDIVTVYTVRAATETAVVSNASTTAQDAGVNAADPNNNRSLSTINGTSFASPTATGAGALVRQYYVDGFYPTGTKVAASGFNPSNMLVKATMINSGRNMTGLGTADNGTGGASAPLPSSGQGWGRLTLDDALYFAGDRRELKVLADIFNGATAPDPTRPALNAAIQTGQTHSYNIDNVSTVEPLRVTLAWADVGATPGASVALVNNLDLEVTDPQGTVFRGNVNFASAFSGAASGAAFDNKNPVECVYIQYPIPGTYIVKVIGANVPGNGSTGVVAQPGNQAIDSNRQGYALLATGNFTAGAQSVIALTASSVAGGVNADRFVGRNETVTAAVTVNNATVVPATNVNVQVAVSATSQIPASLVRINGQAAGQAVTVNYGDLAPLTGRTLGFQITLVDDGVSRAGQTITLSVTMTPANGPPTTTEFKITVGQRIVTYRTRWEPTADPGGENIIVIPEADWVLRPNTGAANVPPAGDPFAGNWALTTATKSPNNGSTASLGDPSGVGTSYGVSTTTRDSGLIFDDSRWWTKKIVLPGLTVDAATNRVSNPAATAQIAAAIESFEVDINADFTGDTNVASLGGDAAIVRVRTYQNTADVNATTDDGFNSNTFTNLLQLESSTPSTGGWRRFTGSGTFASGSGVFGVDTATPNNSDVAFRLELQLRRNGNPQTGDGVFVDNLAVRLRVGDVTAYAAPSGNRSTSVDAASYAASVGTAPGQILSAFGTGFPGGTTVSAPGTTLPLPASRCASTARSRRSTSSASADRSARARSRSTTSCLTRRCPARLTSRC
jgi:hypothetical protein